MKELLIIALGIVGGVGIMISLALCDLAPAVF